jgi:beta-N-acetylhexosaminidase
MFKRLSYFVTFLFIFNIAFIPNVFASCQKILADSKLCTQIGQMVIVGFGGLRQDKQGKIYWNDPNGTVFTPNSLIAKHIARQHVGGVILMLQPWRNAKNQSFIRDRNIVNPQQVAKLNADLQKYNKAIRAKQGLKSLPLFISIDEEGGVIDRLPAVLDFPVRTLIPQAFGAKEESVLNKPAQKAKVLKETYKYALELAQELKAENFNVDFFPTVDVNINPTNPIIGGYGRSFSAKPKVVVDQAQQFIKAFKKKGIIPVLKHFPGHGSSTKDSHLGLVDVTNTYQKNQELYPYTKLISSKFNGMVMTTHVINGQVDRAQCKKGSLKKHQTWCPGTMSRQTLTGLLRNKLGFKGVIISDDITMGAITNEYPLSVVINKAINAGVDIFIVANNYSDQTDDVVDTIAKLVKQGKVSKKRIGQSCKRIMQLKQNTFI